MQDLATFIPFVLIVLVFWFLVIRPARKRQQEMAQIQSSVAPGTEVMLGSGIFGTVVSVEDDTVRLEIAPGTTVKVARQAVVRVVTPTPGAAGHATEPGLTEQPGQPEQPPAAGRDATDEQ